MLNILHRFIISRPLTSSDVSRCKSETTILSGSSPSPPWRTSVREIQAGKSPGSRRHVPGELQVQTERCAECCQGILCSAPPLTWPYVFG